MAQGRNDLTILAKRAQMADWSTEGIAARPDLFKPLPKTGNVIVVDEFWKQLMVVRRLASDAAQDQISAVASAL